jgi:hypothetical protein
MPFRDEFAKKPRIYEFLAISLRTLYEDRSFLEPAPVKVSDRRGVREMKHSGTVVNRVDRIAKKFWKFGWGLVFVSAMTVLAEWGPRLGYSKSSTPATPAISLPARHSVK